jgi:hypothetical protein
VYSKQENPAGGNHDRRSRIATTAGGERTVSSAVIEKFASQLYDDQLAGDDAGCNAARTVWNVMVDKHPALIARCAGAADVVNCICLARENSERKSRQGEMFSCRCAAAATASPDGRVCANRVMIDLSPTKGIRVDPMRRTALAQPGLRLGEFDRETQSFGPLRPVSSSGLMTTCCHPFALRLMTPQEALASLRGRRQAAS